MDDWRPDFGPPPHPSNRPLSYAEFNEDLSYKRFPEKIGRKEILRPMLAWNCH